MHAACRAEDLLVLVAGLPFIERAQTGAAEHLHLWCHPGQRHVVGRSCARSALQPACPRAALSWHAAAAWTAFTQKVCIPAELCQLSSLGTLQAALPLFAAEPPPRQPAGKAFGPVLGSKAASSSSTGQPAQPGSLSSVGQAVKELRLERWGARLCWDPDGGWGYKIWGPDGGPG